MKELIRNKVLDLYPIDYPFESLIARIEAGKLKLNPEFQRKYKWDKDGWVRASKFIESCLMRIPLPSCYFAEEEDGQHIVIDGVQRLTTLKLFFEDGFKLEGLTTFKELEGKRFSELKGHRSDLETTTIRCIVLRKENPKALIREIFSRLNQGAVKLSDQEIRHAIFPGVLDDLLVELAKNQIIEQFKISEDGTYKKDSREDEEQVLRFLAFSEDIELESYENVLSEFLDRFMEVNSNCDEGRVDLYRRRFNTAIENCVAVFEDNIFTDPTKKRGKNGLVYYDLLMPTVGLLSKKIVRDHKLEIREAYNELCSSIAFRKTLSGGLQKKSSILKRRRLWSELLEAAIDG